MENTIYRTPSNLTLEEIWLIMNFLQTLSGDFWGNHEDEWLKKLNQFCHTPPLNEIDDPFEDEIPF